ncbi:MAG: iron-siderophore ABC transporter substrate-binding protein [Cyanobacteria bacterium P01_G01_bin.67]
MKASKFKKFLILPIILGVATASCQSRAKDPSTFASNQADCRAIEHEAGETEICGQPQGIVVLGPYVLEPLLALDVQPVAYADHLAFRQKDYDHPQAQIPYLGSMITQPIANVGIASEPSIEVIAKIQPDLIIGLEVNTKEYDTLSQIAPTILVDWSEPENNLKAISQAVNRPQQVEQLLIETEQRIKAARKTFAPLVASNPKLLLLSSSQLQEINLGNFNHGTCSSLIEELGFQLISSPELNNTEPNTIVPISIETLPQFNQADSVVMLGSNFSEREELDNFESHQLSKIKQAWSENEIAQSLDASQAGRVYFIPAYLCLGLTGAIGTKLYLEELEKQLIPPQYN